jgi:dolichyl-phosphate beta-glucosyltransferase
MVEVPAIPGTTALSVVVPAYNEALRLPRTLQQIRAFADGLSGGVEVIVVDDGSTDGTSALVQAVAATDPRIRLVRLAENQGKGGAVRAGVAAAVGECILFTDADGSIPIGEFDRLHRKLSDGADIAIASRHLRGDSAEVHFKASRRLPGWMFQQFVKSVALSGLSDTQCGFKLFRGPVARELFADTRCRGFAFDVELLMLARRRGYRIAEVAVNCQHVPGSKVRLLHDGLGMCMEVMRIRSAFRSGRYDNRVDAPPLIAEDATGPTDERLQWWAWATLALAVFLAANHLLVRGRAVGLWDSDSQFFPYFALVADYARAGRFLGWDPWTNGGLPTFAEPQVGALSPINNLFALFTGGTSYGFVWYWLAMWFLGGIGIFLLGRHLRAPAWGACVVALGYLFCGVYTANAQHTSWVIGFSFLPLVVWRLDVALVERRTLAAAQAGALWGLSALSAHPSLVILTGCFCMLWTAGRWVDSQQYAPADDRKARRAPGRAENRRLTVAYAAGTIIVLAAVGTVVLAPTYHSFVVEGAGVTARTGALARAEALSNELDPRALSTLVSAYPHRLAAYNRGAIFARSDISMATIYIGVLVPVLAFFALVGGREKRWRWWIAGIGALSLACAMGESLPLRGWLYDAFYPMRVFRHSAVFRLFFLFSVAVLALLGTRDLAGALRRNAAAEWKRFAVLAGLVALAAMAVYALFLYQVRWTGFGTAAYLMPVTWLGLVCAVALCWKLSAERRALLAPILLVALAAGDAALAATLSRPTMLREGRAVERWRSLDAARAREFDLTTLGLHRDESPCDPPPLERCRRNDQVITKRPTFNANPSQWHQVHRTMVGLPVLSQTAIGAERIWFSADAPTAAPVRATFDLFLARAEALGTPPLLLHAREDLIRYAFDDPRAVLTGDTADRLQSAPAMQRLPVRLLAYRPEELVFEVDAPSEGWLLVSDRWAPSWRARVNGEEVPIVGGNFIFRVIQVPEGHSHIEFAYHAAAVSPLVALSWSLLAAIAVASLIATLRERGDTTRGTWPPRRSESAGSKP